MKMPHLPLFVALDLNTHVCVYVYIQEVRRLSVILSSLLPSLSASSLPSCSAWASQPTPWTFPPWLARSARSRFVAVHFDVLIVKKCFAVEIGNVDRVPTNLENLELSGNFVNLEGKVRGFEIWFGNFLWHVTWFATCLSMSWSLHIMCRFN